MFERVSVCVGVGGKVYLCIAHNSLWCVRCFPVFLPPGVSVCVSLCVSLCLSVSVSQCLDTVSLSAAYCMSVSVSTLLLLSCVSLHFRTVSVLLLFLCSLRLTHRTLLVPVSLTAPLLCC